MTLAERVARRFQADTDWTWADVEKELRQLQQTEQLAKGRIDKQTAETLSKAKTFDMLPHAFSEWYRLAYPDMLDVLVESAGEMKHAWRRVVWGYEAVEDLKKTDPDQVEWQKKDLEERIQTAKEATENYISGDVNEAIAQSAEGQFTFEGFTVTNPDRMPKDKLFVATRRIEYLADFFKRRGLLKLLHETLTSIELRMRFHESAAGHYHHQTKHLTIWGDAFRTSQGRLWSTWIDEVFIHEVGHHIHYFLHPQAWEVWKAPWEAVEEKKKLRDTISGADRERFFRLLEKNRFNPATTAKKLSAVDKLKFAQWLRKPGTGESLITPKTFRPSKRGRDVFEFLVDPESYTRRKLNIPRGDDEFIRSQYEGRLKRTIGWVFLVEKGGGGPNSPLDPKIIEEVKKADPSVEEALDAMAIPSEYGKTNFKEDFAETFVLFMVDPGKLSPTAKFRMQQALAVSGLYGKSVGKFARMAQRVADRWLCG